MGLKFFRLPVSCPFRVPLVFNWLVGTCGFSPSRRGNATQRSTTQTRVWRLGGMSTSQGWGQEGGREGNLDPGKGSQ